MKEFILLDGKPIREGFPVRSLSYGEGVFETFRWKATPPVFFNNHIQRMKKGAEVLGIPFPGVEGIKKSVEEIVLSSQVSDAYVKICLMSQGAPVFYENPHGTSLMLIVREYQPSNEPIKAHIPSFRRNSTSPIPKLKSLNSLENVLARREAMKLGFDEALFLNERGEITEGSATNIFWLKDGVLFTPSLECGLLSGVIRGVVIELAAEIGIEIIEGSFGLDSVKSSQGAFFTNSLIEAAPISQIDEFKLRTDSNGFYIIKTALLQRLGW
jgi:4-amino-4-deoxychorismate lyase